MRLAFWNVGDGPDAIKWAALTRLLDHDPDVVVVVEVADRIRLLSQWASVRGWYVWHGDGQPGGKSIAIMVKDPDAVIARGTYPGTPRTEVGEFGAGPDVVKAKVLQLLSYLDEDGFRVDIIGLHAPASTTRRVPPGTPGRKPKRRTVRRRRRLARRLFRRAINLVHAYHDRGEYAEWPVVVVGDFNAGPRSRLLRAFRRDGLVEVVRRPTFKGQHYDQAWVGNGTGRLVAVVPMPGHDHDAFVVEVERA